MKETAGVLIEMADAEIKHQQGTLFSGLSYQLKKGTQWAVPDVGSGRERDFLDVLAGQYRVVAGSRNYYFGPLHDPQEQATAGYATHFDAMMRVNMNHDFKNLSHTKDFYYQQRYNAWDAEDAPRVSDYLAEQQEKAWTKAGWEVEEVMELFELQPLRDKHLIKLSNGESKRLRLAAALLRNPVVLLLDQPLTGLDVRMQARFQEILKVIAQKGVTMVILTDADHIPDVVTHVACVGGEKVTCMEKAAFATTSKEAATSEQPNEAILKEVMAQVQHASYSAIVRMEQVSVKYDAYILKDVSWEVQQGERWALSGANGSGKSTLLSLINGDHPQAYANHIELFGRKRGTGESIWDIKKKIGYMSPELYQCFPMTYSSVEVIVSGLHDTMGLYKAPTEAERALALQWLELMKMDQPDQPLYQRSALERRNTLLARAMIKNPVLLMLDEPCQGMSAAPQQYFRNIVDAIAAHSDMTLIYVTHNQETLPQCITHHFELG